MVHFSFECLILYMLSKLKSVILLIIPLSFMFQSQLYVFSSIFFSFTRDVFEGSRRVALHVFIGRSDCFFLSSFCGQSLIDHLGVSLDPNLGIFFHNESSSCSSQGDQDCVYPPLFGLLSAPVLSLSSQLLLFSHSAKQAFLPRLCQSS